jgi:hypothetical protein
MPKPAKVQDKYFLKSLHEEIDLYDRKLVHVAKFERFDNEDARTAMLAKMTTKRETLAENARQLMKDGIEFRSTDLPRSFRPQTEGEQLVAAPELTTPQPATAAN